jgi:plasmid maintenance system antidote protein VapI
MPTSTLLNPLQIYLAARGITVAQMARDLGWRKHRVQKTVKCQRFSPDVREAISRYLGLSPSRMWRKKGLNQDYLITMAEKSIQAQAMADAQRKIEAMRELAA